MVEVFHSLVFSVVFQWDHESTRNKISLICIPLGVSLTTFFVLFRSHLKWCAASCFYVESKESLSVNYFESDGNNFFSDFQMKSGFYC